MIRSEDEIRTRLSGIVPSAVLVPADPKDRPRADALRFALTTLEVKGPILAEERIQEEIRRFEKEVGLWPEEYVKELRWTLR